MNTTSVEPSFVLTSNYHVATLADGSPIAQEHELEDVADSYAAKFTATGAQRWIEKATAYVTAWRARFNAYPSIANIVLGLAVAQHETWCGDAWAGEHNWGACQCPNGILTTAERAACDAAGVTTIPADIPKARAALAAAGLTRANAALHCDSSPGKGWYFVYFFAFKDDLGGAGKFIEALAADRAACKAVLENATGALSPETFALASAMYHSHYFEGFYEPNKDYPQKDGTTKKGSDLDIEAYANACLLIAPGIASALGGLKPDALDPTPTPAPAPVPSTPPAMNLTTTSGVQVALSYLARKLGRPGYDTKGVDGVLGPNTKAAIIAFQKDTIGLVADGSPGPLTQAALQSALDKIRSA